MGRSRPFSYRRVKLRSENTKLRDESFKGKKLGVEWSN
jgi:hypothetical protein